ncbi:GEVED domain-containing protein [Hymenobacter terricola]|uniref:GEVED domain-containing protein n=1 Tax=Hymenobacter terricola TaxID=2819236 RepID=UPI001B304345|nr:GEVED domain-containing protein [Hymenobacter terricola]
MGQYLNLWAGTIGGGILGYTQFPGGAAAANGVVISPVYFGRTGTSATTRTGSFTVSASAKSGATRLRVVMSDNSATTSCGSFSYGETGDYTVTISGGARLDGSAARPGNGLADQYTLRTRLPTCCALPVR